MDDINYKAFELEHLQALSVKQKEADMDERRKLAEDIEKAKDDLNELVNKLKNLKNLIFFFLIRKKQMFSKLKRN